MADENEEIVEVEALEQSGQEPENTTIPEAEKKQESEEILIPKTFTQEELEDVVQRRLARERRKFEREHTAATELPPLQIESKLDPNQFTTTEDYLEALADERVEAKIAHRDQNKSVNEINNKYRDAVDAAIEKYPDFEQVAHTHKFMTSDMAAVIKSSDVATELAYFLGTNLKEAERIFKLPPMLQVKELGKLEAKLESAPLVVVKPSSAPAPIKPLQGKTIPTITDTTDPRSTKTMTASQWIAADRQRREAIMRAKGLN